MTRPRNDSPVAVMGYGSEVASPAPGPVSMREKMARRAHRVFKAKLSGGLYDERFSHYVWGESKETQERWFAVIDAVLDAMMEPSGGVVRSIMDAVNDEDRCEDRCCIDRADAVRAASSMIRAIKEGK